MRLSASAGIIFAIKKRIVCHLEAGLTNMFVTNSRGVRINCASESDTTSSVYETTETKLIIMIVS